MNEQTFEIQHIIDRAAADFMMIDFLSIDSVENLYKELKGVCDTFTVLQMVEDCRLIREIIDEFEIIFKSFSNLKATAADDEHKFNEVLEEIQMNIALHWENLKTRIPGRHQANPLNSIHLCLNQM